MMDVEEMSMTNIDLACMAFYGNDIGRQKEAHDYLLRIVDLPDSYSILFKVLNQTTETQTLVFSTYALANVCEKRWRNLDNVVRKTIRNWCMNWLYTRGPKYVETRRQEENEVVRGVIRLLGVVVSYGWLEMSSSSRFVKDTELFLNSDDTLHWVLVMDLFEHIVAQMNPGTVEGGQRAKGSIRKIRTAASFRETALGEIFSHSCRLLIQWGDGTLRVSEKWMESYLLLGSIKSISQCLTFDFTGETAEDTEDGAKMLMLPFTWKNYGLNRLPPLLFSVIRKGISDTSERARECLIQCWHSLAALASIRRTFFAQSSDRERYNAVILNEMAGLLIDTETRQPSAVYRSILEDDELYHGFSELSNRIMRCCMRPVCKMTTFTVWLNWIGQLKQLSLDAFRDPDSSNLIKVKHEILKAWVEVPSILDRNMGHELMHLNMMMHKQEVDSFQSDGVDVMRAFIETRMSAFSTCDDDDEVQELMQEWLNDVVLQEQMDYISNFIRYHNGCRNFRQRGSEDPHAKQCLQWIIQLKSSLSGGNLSLSQLCQSAFCISVASACLDAYKNQFKTLAMSNKYRVFDLSTSSQSLLLDEHAKTCGHVSMLVTALLEFIEELRPFSLSVLNQRDNPIKILESTILQTIKTILELLLPEFYHLGKGDAENGIPTVLKCLGISEDSTLVDTLVAMLLDSNTILDESLDIIENLIRTVRTRPQYQSMETSRSQNLSVIGYGYGFVGPIIAESKPIVDIIQSMSHRTMETTNGLRVHSDSSLVQLFRILVLLESYTTPKQPIHMADTSIRQIHATRLIGFLQDAWPQMHHFLANQDNTINAEFSQNMRICLSAVQGICEYPCQRSMNGYHGSYEEYIMTQVCLSLNEPQMYEPKWLSTLKLLSYKLMACTVRAIAERADVDNLLDEFSRCFHFVRKILYPARRPKSISTNAEPHKWNIMVFEQFIQELIGPYVVLRPTTMKVKDRWTKVRSDIACLDLITETILDKVVMVEQAAEFYEKVIAFALNRDLDEIQQYEELNTSVVHFLSAIASDTECVSRVILPSTDYMTTVLGLLADGLYSTDELTLHRIINVLSALVENIVTAKKEGNSGITHIVAANESRLDTILATIYRLLTTSPNASISWSLSRPFLALSLIRPESLSRITQEQVELVDESKRSRATLIFTNLMMSIESNNNTNSTENYQDFPHQLFKFVALQKNLMV